MGIFATNAPDLDDQINGEVILWPDCGITAEGAPSRQDVPTRVGIEETPVDFLNLLAVILPAWADIPADYSEKKDTNLFGTLNQFDLG